MTKGYLKRPDLTARLFDEEGYACLGDLVEYDENGFIYFIGRDKDSIRCEERTISPRLLNFLL